MVFGSHSNARTTKKGKDPIDNMFIKSDHEFKTFTLDSDNPYFSHFPLTTVVIKKRKLRE